MNTNMFVLDIGMDRVGKSKDFMIFYYNNDK